MIAENEIILWVKFSDRGGGFFHVDLFLEEREGVICCVKLYLD